MMVQGVHPGYTTRSLPELPNARSILDHVVDDSPFAFAEL